MSAVAISPHRFYIDSMVLVYYLKTRYKPFLSGLSKEFLKKVEEGKYEGVMSILVLMELIKILREILVQIENIHNPVDWQKEIRTAIESIFRIKNIYIIEGSPTERVGTTEIRDILYSSIVWEAYDILNKYPGKTGQYEEKFLHDGISPMDGMHIVVAKRIGCGKIATFDRDFEETKNEIEPVILDKDIW